jgi:hypothetical protein
MLHEEDAERRLPTCGLLKATTTDEKQFNLFGRSVPTEGGTKAKRKMWKPVGEEYFSAKEDPSLEVNAGVSAGDDVGGPQKRKQGGYVTPAPALFLGPGEEPEPGTLASRQLALRKRWSVERRYTGSDSWSLLVKAWPKPKLRFTTRTYHTLAAASPTR